MCALALVHVPGLAPVLAEFARVLRPGGHLVISDVHHELVMLGSVVHAPGPAGEPGLAPTYRHSTGDYLRAALPVGLRVRRCEEPRPMLPDQPPSPPEKITVTEWADWPWTLLPLIPAATRRRLGQAVHHHLALPTRPPLTDHRPDPPPRQPAEGPPVRARSCREADDRWCTHSRTDPDFVGLDPGNLGLSAEEAALHQIQQSALPDAATEPDMGGHAESRGRRMMV